VTEPPAKDDLESVLRADEPSDDLVLLLRAGAEGDDVDLLTRQAARLNRHYTYEGGACFGISVFAATEENEAWVLATKMDVRRRYFRIKHADIAGLGCCPPSRRRTGKSSSTDRRDPTTTVTPGSIGEDGARRPPGRVPGPV